MRPLRPIHVLNLVVIVLVLALAAWLGRSSSRSSAGRLQQAARGIPLGCSWAPEGQRLAYEFGDVTMVWDLRDGSVRNVCPNWGGPAWSPNADILAFPGRTYNLSNGQTRVIPKGHVSWYPDGKHLLVAGAFALQAVDPDSGLGVAALGWDRTKMTVWDQVHRIGTACLSPDGKQVAVSLPGGNDGTFYKWFVTRAEHWDPQDVLRGMPRDFIPTTLQRDGQEWKFVMPAQRKSSDSGWFAFTKDGYVADVRSVYRTVRSDGQPAYAEISRIVWIDRNLETYRFLAEGHAPHASPTRDEIAFTDGSTVVVMGLPGGSARVFELESGYTLVGLDGLNLQWSPDGNRIAVCTGRPAPSGSSAAGIPPVEGRVVVFPVH